MEDEKLVFYHNYSNYHLFIDRDKVDEKGNFTAELINDKGETVFYFLIGGFIVM